MKITRVTAKSVKKTLDGTLWNPQTRWTEKEAAIVIVETDQGISGLGEAWTFGGGSAPIISLIEDLARLVVGRDPRMISAIWHDLHKTNIVSAKGGILFHAISAIDIALWDIAGKACNQPIHRLLGGHTDRLFTYASGGLYGRGKTESDLAEEMAGYVRLGFKGVKIKVGAVSIEEDLARIAAVREAIGRNALLMIDGVWTYTMREALELSRRAASYQILYFEAPLPAGDIEGCARVNARSEIPLCGQDHGSGLDFYRRLIDARAVDYVLLAPIACGGLSEAMRIAALAKAAHLPCTLHSSSTVVSFMACLHLAAALANCHSVEFHQIHQMLFDHAPAELLALHDGHLAAPDRPGLGIALDEKLLAEVV